MSFHCLGIYTGQRRMNLLYSPEEPNRKVRFIIFRKSEMCTNSLCDFLILFRTPYTCIYCYMIKAQSDETKSYNLFILHVYYVRT